MKLEIQQLSEHKAYLLRYWSLIQTTEADSGHATSCLSAADIVAALFFYTMRYNPADYNYPNNDRFILSKGHAAPLLYAAWKEAGVLTDDDLARYRQLDSVLEGHPTLRFSHTEAATGALGNGLGIGLGEALAARMNDLSYRTYVLMGDAEFQEGSIFEALEVAGFYKTSQLIGIVDLNRLGQSCESIWDHHIEKLRSLIHYFGWHVIAINGHDMQQIVNALDETKTITDKPIMILAKTFKGYGISSVQDKQGYHGKPFSKKELEGVLAELKKNFAQAATYKNDHWKPQLPEKHEHAVQLNKTCPQMPEPTYTIGEQIATRKAFGQALKVLGDVSDEVISLDADVKNSTYAEIFEAAHPDRFVQAFVAEQNMINMAVGFERRGKIPFASTFSCFFTRAHDQIRMAAIGQSKLRLVGSHAGVSIGEDGPSQMGLEDISFMSCLPESIVLYPSDAVSTYKLVQLMACYEKGISYLRTTRMATPVLYKNGEDFRIGGCKVLKKDKRDKVCVIGAGITLHEALKAYDALVLEEQQLFVSVIDLYSVKPLDSETIIMTAKESGNKILTVEDHYIQGGIGQIVKAALINTGIYVESMAVDQLPRSGKPEQLIAHYKIDSFAIIERIKFMISK